MTPRVGLLLVWLFWVLDGMAWPSRLTAQEARDTSRVTIEARVLDFGSWTPLEGVRVSLPDLEMETRTDSDGRFRIESVRRGIYQLILGRDGYLTADGLSFRPPASAQPGERPGFRLGSLWRVVSIESPG